jgi:anti-sigma factor ChrR (cupin superfamily)
MEPGQASDVTLINADFEQRVVLPPCAADDWIQSPMKGVRRRMLDRVGGEVARATSLVRYAPDSVFARHVHGGGEEFLVLEGTFSDEHGDYPAGTYVRNPPGSGHAPYSREGCTLFVKLWQFARGDSRPVRIDTRTAEWHPGLVPGLSVMPLHEFDGISTAHSSARMLTRVARKSSCCGDCFATNTAHIRPARGCETLAGAGTGRSPEPKAH